MSTSRRRIVRPPRSHPPSQAPPLRVQKLRIRLEQERRALSRWLTRLKRAFPALEQPQRKVAQLERQIAHLEDGVCQRRLVVALIPKRKDKPSLTLTEQLTDYIHAAFSGLWVQTREPDEAERAILQLARTKKWNVAVPR